MACKFACAVAMGANVLYINFSVKLNTKNSVSKAKFTTTVTTTNSGAQASLDTMYAALLISEVFLAQILEDAVQRKTQSRRSQIFPA